MEKKEHDIFMEMLDNQQASIYTMITVGLNPSNTTIQDKSVYQKDEWVQDKFKDQYGNFDQSSFDKAYETAKLCYNNLSSVSYQEAMMKQAEFHRSSLLSPEDQRREGPDFKQIKISNPNEQVFGLTTLGKIEEPTKSIDELAQSHRVLANPTTAGDNLENAQWEDSPNDNFFGNFFDTLVLAQYDSDGVHIDPVTGQEVTHSKGDLRLNNEGQFYYEKLDGRDVYGRRVLNKMNVLTTDGSFWNTYDFFDSDDIEQKSIGGTALKNLALVGSMFIPYVGPWITGLSLATQLAGVGATLGKMLAGSDNPTLSAIEGWAQSMNRQTAKTQYAQEHTWCWENFISLIGDTMGQLREQRFIFEKLPYVIKGSNITTKEGYAQKLKDLQKSNKQITEAKIEELIKNPISVKQLQQAKNELYTINALKTQADMDSFVKGYYKLGEIFSKGYMTAITVKDTYGEAKLAGASDLDATLLTLGYAAGEYALLSTGLGEWILPELRAGRYKAQAIAKALTQVDADTQELRKQFGNALKKFPKEGKKEYVKNLFNIGKNIATAEYANGTKTLAASLAAGAGEGVEEFSEELLADFSKGCYNVVKWLQGDETRINSFGYDFDKDSWNVSEALDRYGMSLVGGAVGGGLTNVVTNYKTINQLNNLTSQQAIQELVYMVRNEQTKDFLKSVDKMQLGDPNFSATEFEESDGVLSFSPGTKTDNQDLFAKQAIKQQVKLIENILQANGAQLSDNSFLDIQTLKDLRFQALHQSTTAGAYLNEFNSLSSQLVNLNNQLKITIDSALDSNQDGTVSDPEQRRNKLSDEDKQKVKNIEEQIKQVKQQLKDLLEGKRSYEFISEALFEMTGNLSGRFTTVTFPLYAENYYGRKYNQLTENDKAVAWKSYEQWKVSDGRDKIRQMAQIYRNISEQVSQVIKNQENLYLQDTGNLQELDSLISDLYNTVSRGNADDYLSDIQNAQNASTTNTSRYLIYKLGSEQDKLELQALEKQLQGIDTTLPKEKYEELRKQKYLEFLRKQSEIVLENIESYLSPIISRGFANSETKNQLKKVLNNVETLVIAKEQEAQDNYDVFNPKSEEDLTYWSNKLVSVQQLKKQLDNLNNTPFEENLNQFSISIGSNPINITQLIERLNKSFEDNSSDITKFNIDSDLYKDLENAINTIELYQSTILGARTDAAGIGDYYGYNATLNEIMQKSEENYTPLAEISSQVADIFIADINTNLNKLKFLKNLYQINQSRKLSKQDRISTKKDLLIYRRLKNIVQVQDNDPLIKWNGFLELQNIINGMSIHESLVQNKQNSVPDSQREQFEKEKLAVEDAIYEFFQKNQDKLNNVDDLKQLLNPSRLNLYTEAKELLNENLESLDDNSIIWWLASRAAIKATDFYSRYKEILDPKAERLLAPIPTQELAVYNNYANIVNGNVFTQFYKAVRQGIIDDWKNKSIEDRNKVLKILNKEASILSEEALAKYVLNIVSAPRYSNIVLTEGVPGSGKTSAVFEQTIKLLQRFHPDSELLKRVAIVHGADINSAKKLQEAVSLDAKNSSVYGREEWMKEINPTWKEYPIDPTNQKYLVPKSDFTITNEYEIRSSLGIKETQTPPSLILIDEISKFSAYDLDQIDAFARKYGITVLVAGDFDQDGVVGSHPINIEGNQLTWNVSLDRTNFIRTPKLGVSMRTDNSLKVGNLQKVQAYIQNPTNEVIELEEYWDEQGLYGDSVVNYTIENSNVEDSSVNIGKTYIIQEVIQKVDKLIDTLGENEKIGYIYTDKNSPIFKELSSDKYSRYIDFKKGGSAQGLEGRYYIIEATPTAQLNSESENIKETFTSIYMKNIYTGISRAQQGSILIVPLDAGPKFKRHLVSEKVNDTLNKNLIANYTAKRKELLDKVAQSTNKIEYVPRNTNGTTTVLSPQQRQSNGLPDGDNLSSSSITPLDMINAINECENSTELDQLESDYKGSTILTNSEVVKALQQKRQQFESSSTDQQQNQIKIIPFEEVPEDIRANILEAQKAAIANPVTDLGFDKDDRDSDIKYGQIVKISDDYGVVVGVKQGGESDIFYDILYPSQPTSNNAWGYESGSHFRTELTGIIKQEETNPNENYTAEQLIYADNTAPFIEEIISEEEYKGQMDLSNQNVQIPSSEAYDSEETIGIQMLLHTFNTFESGVQIGNDGKPIPVGGQEWMDARIDSVNGLVKIDKLLGRELRTEEEYIKQIGRLRGILFNVKDKAEIVQKLQNDLELSNIYITFALKSSPRGGDRNKESNTEFVESEPTPFSKGISERTLFNGSSDTRSHECHTKSIVAIIGTKQGGNILELPLIALSSPFTLMQVKNSNNTLVFQEVYDKFQQLQSQGLSIHDITLKLIAEFENVPKYRSLINLFKFFDFTDRGIFYIRDTQWTPAKNLTLLGPQFVTNRGYYQGAPGLGYDQDAVPENEWVTIDKIAQNPELRVTKKVLMSLSGYVDNGNGVTMKIANAGHAFVLVSYDPELNSDKKIVDYFILQESDQSVPKKVKLMYVLPPKASILEYIENLKKIVSKDQGVKNIGRLFTSYKLMRVLLQNDSFRQILERKSPKLLTKVQEAINELDSLPDTVAKKNKLYEPQNWSDTGLSAKPIALAGLLDGALINAAYNRNTLNSLIGEKNQMILDQDAVDLITAILQQSGIDGVYYNVKIPKDGGDLIGSLNVPIQGNNYTIDSKPFRIHGKLDSYTFKGDMDWLVQGFLDNLRVSKDGKHRFTVDGYSYMKDRNSDIESKPISKEQLDKDNKVLYVKNKTGIDVSQIYNDNSVPEANKQVVNNVNLNNNQQIAFTLGNELKISNKHKELTGRIILYDNSDNVITDLQGLSDNNGVYTFIVDSNNTRYSAEYNITNNELILTPINNQSNTASVGLSINLQNFDDYVNEARIALEPMFEWDVDYQELFSSQSYDQFVAALNEMDIIGEDRINDLEEMLGSQNLTDKQESIIKELIEFERQKFEEDQNDSCPISLKIKF